MPRREREDPIAPLPTDDSIEDADGAALLARRVVQRAADTAAGVLSDAVGAGGRLVRRSQQGRALRRGRNELSNLFELHPETRTASRRQVGLRTIPTTEIVGTAVEGGAQRGVDFLPLRPMRSRNWRARYQRVRDAQERLAVLPPIDVLQTDEGYWVVDGHNRVAAALAGGQDDIDAVVTHVHLPGSKEPEMADGSLAAMLADGEELRAAGAGLLTPGSSLASRLGDPGAQWRFRDPSARPALKGEPHQPGTSDQAGGPSEPEQSGR